MPGLACAGVTGMLARMKWISGISLVAAWVTGVAHAAIAPEAVAIIYNSDLPESRRLAEIYQEARGIPATNLVAMSLPKKPDISREEYEEMILKPLRNQFDFRSWWERKVDGGGVKLPVLNKIRVIVLMRGVPLRIEPKPKPPAKPDEPPAPPPSDPVGARDEASVDSELAMFGVEGLPIGGVLANKYHRNDQSITDAELPYLVLTARIDGPSYAICERMIRDAVEVEKTGLWGRSYVDVANKFPQGDAWLEDVVKANAGVGIPTVVDRFNDTLPKNYPMTEAAFYDGWYDGHVSGPFLNPGFRFKKGAIAMHLHSFSAEQLGDAEKNWCAPLLARGAAATVGNVYEPYLHLTHDFGLIQRRLLEGMTWVEACWMAMPVTSWQGVVLGDPLYRPFKHLSGTGEKLEADIPYRALRASTIEWGKSALERQMQLEKASERMKSGVLMEAVGLDFLRVAKPEDAAKAFQKAKEYFSNPADQLRQDFHLIAMERAANHKDKAILALREALTRYSGIPESEAVKGWLDILDPPPPPPADPNKAPAIAKP